MVGLGASFIQFQPLVVEGDALKNAFTLSAKNWGLFLKKIYKRWYQKKHLGKVFILNIEEVYAQYFLQRSSNCVHAPRCGTNLVMEPDGSTYACDHFLVQNCFLGKLEVKRSLTDMVLKSSQLTFGKNKSIRSECIACSVYSVCHGGCPAHLDQKKQNHLCEGYHDFFSSILASLRQYTQDEYGLARWKNDLERMKI